LFIAPYLADVIVVKGSTPPFGVRGGWEGLL